MVIKMRTYYLFIIKDNVKKTYENNSGDLYQKLKIIKNSDINLNYKLTLYKQICNEFKTDVISSYLKSSGFKNEQMIKAMMSQMGRTPSQKQINQMMKTMTKHMD